MFTPAKRVEIVNGGITPVNLTIYTTVSGVAETALLVNSPRVPDSRHQ